MSDSSLVSTLLGRQKLAQLASYSASGPRVFSVWIAVDAPANALVFISSTTSNHSTDWAADARAGGTLVGVTPVGLGQAVDGLSFFGTVSVVRGDRLEQLYETYVAEWPQAPDLIPLSLLQSEESGVGLYELAVQEWVVYSENSGPEPLRVSVSV